jgi:hypothetical protein
MKLGIMQPYFFPYLGYFQLVRLTDKFVFYDDVAYIKGGWINRNRILISGQTHFITVPTCGASPNVLISEVGINAQNPRWKRKMIDGFFQAYRATPHAQVAGALLQKVLETPVSHVGELAKHSVLMSLELLELGSSTVWSSSQYKNGQLRSQERVIDICTREQATTYINASGGHGLYNTPDFAARGIQLKFSKPVLAEYPQATGEFVPGLSILDVIASTGLETTRSLIAQAALTDD